MGWGVGLPALPTSIRLERTNAQAYLAVASRATKKVFNVDNWAYVLKLFTLLINSVA